MATQFTAYDGTVFTISPEGIEARDDLRRDRVMMEAELFRVGATGPRAEAAKGTLNYLMDRYGREAVTAASDPDGLGLSLRDLKAASLVPPLDGPQEVMAGGASDKDLVDRYRSLPSHDSEEVDGMWRGDMDNVSQWRQTQRMKEMDRRGLRLGNLSAAVPELRIETLPPEARAEWERINRGEGPGGRTSKEHWALVGRGKSLSDVGFPDWDAYMTSEARQRERELYEDLPMEGAEQRLGEQPRPVPPSGGRFGPSMSAAPPSRPDTWESQYWAPDRTYADKRLRELQTGLPFKGEQLRLGEMPRPVPVRDDRVERGEDTQEAYRKAKRAILNGE